MSWAFCNLYTVYIHMFHITISSKYLGYECTADFFSKFIFWGICRMAQPFPSPAVPVGSHLRLDDQLSCLLEISTAKVGYFWIFVSDMYRVLPVLQTGLGVSMLVLFLVLQSPKWIKTLTQDIPIKVGTAQTHRRRKKTFLNKNINSPSNLCVFSCFFLTKTPQFPWVFGRFFYGTKVLPPQWCKRILSIARRPPHLPGMTHPPQVPRSRVCLLVNFRHAFGTIIGGVLFPTLIWNYEQIGTQQVISSVPIIFRLESNT